MHENMRMRCVSPETEFNVSRKSSRFESKGSVDLQTLDSRNLLIKYMRPEQRDHKGYETR